PSGRPVRSSGDGETMRIHPGSALTSTPKTHTQEGCSMSFANHVRRAATTLALAAILALPTGARAAFVPLPANGAQVNNDPVNSIDPNQDAGVSDVTGGTVVAGTVPVPWATFEQKTGAYPPICLRALTTC